MQESGDLTRTTDIVYEHDFQPYIRAKLKQADVTVNGETTERSYAYDLGTGFRQSQTVYGVTTAFSPDAFGNVATVTDANGNQTTFTHDWGVVKNTTTPE